MQRHKNNCLLKIRNLKFSFLIVTSFLLYSSFSSAQTATSSPYSRYGIGDLNGKGSAQNFAMGGTLLAVQNDTIPMYFINNGNPASYSNIRLTTAELGVNFNRVTMQNSSTKKSINSAAITNILLAFPFKKWWSASIGLLPYSSVGYKIEDHQNILNIGDVDFLYQGSGGINQFYFGNGIKPLFGLPKLFLNSKKYQRLRSEKKDSEILHILNRKKSLQNLSIGFNASYLFGNLENSRRSIFPQSAYPLGAASSFSTYNGTTTRIADFYMDYGAQYAFTIDSLKGRDLKENVKIILGATFASQTNMNASIDSLSYTYYLMPTGYERTKDTIENVTNSKGTLTFPLSFGFGFGFKKGERWLVAADYAMQNWSEYRSFNQSQNLKNSMRISLGIQFVPNAKASGKGTYYRRIHYRMGARYSQSAIELKSTRLTESALSAGIGFPVGRNYLLQSFSMVNIGLEIGQRGTVTNGLIKEQFFKATVGFTINDRWFIKPKFD